MEIFLNKKENFIYQNDNSLPDIFCQELIQDYQDIITKENTRVDINFSIKKCLLNEVNKHIQNYKNIIYNRNCYTKNIINSINIKNIDEDANFFIKKIEYNNEIQYNENIISNKKINDDIEVLQYIWFLNDCKCKIIFWDDFIINPKMGKLIIFPISWCFPYRIEFEDINMESNVITGKILCTINKESSC